MTFSVANAFSSITAPIVLLTSIPLAIFAVLTTTLAFWLLFIRVFVVYVELLAVLLRAYLDPFRSLRVKLPSGYTSKPRQVEPAKGSYRSFISAELHPKVKGQSRSSVDLLGNVSTRDFEGVGGWRVEGDADEEALWMGMNSRLELPAITTHRQRHRDLTSSSQQSSGSSSPVLLRSPTIIRGRTGTRFRAGGESPEGYFSLPVSSTEPSSQGSGVTLRLPRRSTSHSTVSLHSLSKLSRSDDAEKGS